MIRLVVYFIFLVGLLLSQEATAFIKYFNNDRDFLGDKPMLASERNNKKHIRVSYNETKQPILKDCLLYTSPSPRDGLLSRMPSSA